MSSQHLNNGGDSVSGDVNLRASPLLDPQLPVSNACGIMGETGSEIGFQILSPSCLAQDGRGKKRSKDEGDRFLRVENRGLTFKLGEEDIEAKSCGGERNGRTKLCARGHWRPAEDAKLKELVAQYGPQNWNLIANHLQGRSGNPQPQKPEFFFSFNL